MVYKQTQFVEHFVCDDFKNGQCYNTDLNDCCSHPGVSNVCSIHVNYTTPVCADASSNSIRLPLTTEEWLGMMRNTSTEKIVVPSDFGTRLAMIASHAMVSAQHSKICHQENDPMFASTSCSQIVDADTCEKSYQTIVSGAVVSACAWQSSACTRTSAVVRLCKTIN
jgi:hypothetical protein